ncbi:arginine--tRNA ligase [[Mycoplasma] anseris]|uniref:Arginine--tRNA ligase n=1 Tax=[Mycoplasma] anseris TaxID=92400 RepID=A0A2Z4NCQ0_9BACT|nr:arginine--tRNA ligase [[Mycoplasma] anseris]AWX69344.1 arginine--tRNA ligase [[Mycoplasma] anseris]
MNTTKDIIVSSLEEALKKLDISKPVVLKESKNYGDYSTNLPLTLQKEMGKKAMDIASEIVKNIDLKKYTEIAEIQVAEPGFINFWVSNSVLADTINSINQLGEEYGDVKEEKGAVNIEYVSANPTGYLHIGHARNAAVGATLCNVMKKAGHRVVSEYIINDHGNQMNNLANSLFARYQQIFDKDFPMPQDSYRGGDIIDFAQAFYNDYKDQYKGVEYTDEIKAFFREYGRNIALENIKKDLKNFGIEIEIYSSEEEMYQKNLILPRVNRLKTIYKKDGATWLETTKGGRDDKDRVVLKSDGSTTYFCTDIAYHPIKFDRLNDQNGKIIDIWGADHSGYVERVKFAFEDQGYRRDQIEMVLFQLLRIVKDGVEIKMSKRLGTSFTMRELLDLVGKDPVRYFLIDRSYNSKIDFDVKKVTEANETNPMYIIKYAHARCAQLLDKANIKDPKATKFDDEYSLKLINDLKEYPDLIKTMAKNYKVNLLPPYLLKLAGSFNSFYSNTKVLGNENEESYVALVKATKIVLASGMRLMDLDIPDKM